MLAHSTPLLPPLLPPLLLLLHITLLPPSPTLPLPLPPTPSFWPLLHETSYCGSATKSFSGSSSDGIWGWKRWTSTASLWSTPTTFASSVSRCSRCLCRRRERRVRAGDWVRRSGRARRIGTSLAGFLPNSVN